MVQLGGSTSVANWDGVADHFSARDALAEAVIRLGGVDGLVEWVLADERNADRFWTILFPRLLAAQSANGAMGKGAGAAITAVEWRVRDAAAPPDGAREEGA